MNNPTPDTRQWDQFWQSGRTSCCSDHDGSANAEIIRGLWTEFFGSLGDDRRLLDLCTGNGAVVNIALECAGKSGIRITACGVDSASIAPTARLERNRCADPLFIRASVAALPFEDCCFDTITSQFGIEYTALEQAIAEALRVLSSGGKGMFVTHARGGVTATDARAELADIDELQQQIRLFPAAQAALERVCAVERTTCPPTPAQLAAARSAYEAFRQRVERVRGDWRKRAASAVFRDAGDILRHTFQNRHAYPVAVLVDKVRETEQSVILHRDRLQALVDSVLEQDDCEQIVSACRRQGVSACEFSPVVAADRAGQLAWAIRLRK